MRSKYVAIGCQDGSVKILSLDPENCLNKVSMQSFPAIPESVKLVGDLYLYIGLANGLMLKTAVDSVTGTLSDTRSKYLGINPVSLHKIRVNNETAVLGISSKSWLAYNYMGKSITLQIE